MAHSSALRFIGFGICAALVSFLPLITSPPAVGQTSPAEAQIQLDIRQKELELKRIPIILKHSLHV